jgi:hypothetical protein
LLLGRVEPRDYVGQNLPLVGREDLDGQLGLRLRLARFGRRAGAARLVEREQHQPHEREAGETAVERLAGAVVLVGRPGRLREHQDEQERHDDRAGVDDDGRGHQKRRGEKQEQPAGAEDDERERDRPAGRVPLHHQYRAEDERTHREHPEQDAPDDVRQRLTERLVDPRAEYRDGRDERGDSAGDEPPARPRQQQEKPRDAERDRQGDLPAGFLRFGQREEGHARFVKFVTSETSMVYCARQ